MSEFTHVAEFFQVTFGLSIPLLIVSQVLAFRYALWEPIQRIAEHDHEAYERWLENQKDYRGDQNQALPDVPPNSVDRNIKEQLNPNTDQSEDIPKNNILDQKKQDEPSQESRKSNPDTKDKEELTVCVANQSSPSNYPIEQTPYLKLYIQTNLIFNEYVPVVMVCMTLGILLQSTLIFSMLCFFCYLIVNLIFNYAQLFQKLATKTENPMTPQIISNLSGAFLIAFFIGQFIRTQYGA